MSRIFQRSPAGIYFVKWLFLSALVGVCAGTASAGFLLTLDWATGFRESHVWIIALLPVGGLAIGLLYRYLGQDIEGGNNLLFDSIHDPKGTISFRMAPFVFLGTVVTHLFGGSAGREGTAIQMAGSLSDQFSKPLRLSAGDKKILLVAAIAAGFGSVFGTPLAGAVFGLEVLVLGRFPYAAILPALAASILADLVTRAWGVHHTVYSIGPIPAITPFRLLTAAVAGIAFGLCAAVFSRSIHALTALFKKNIAFAPLRPVIGGVLVAVAVFATGTTKFVGLGILTILTSFNTALPPYDFLIKMAFTLVTLSAGFKGGEVTPLFFIGTVLGNALAYLLPLPIGLLSGMGFVAVFAGCTKTPVACTLMAMELFGGGCGLFAGIACMVAYLFSGKTGIYHARRMGEFKL